MWEHHHHRIITPNPTSWWRITIGSVHVESKEFGNASGTFDLVASSIQHPASSVKHQASSIDNLTSHFPKYLLTFRHQASRDWASRQLLVDFNFHTAHRSSPALRNDRPNWTAKASHLSIFLFFSFLFFLFFLLNSSIALDLPSPWLQKYLNLSSLWVGVPENTLPNTYLT